MGGTAAVSAVAIFIDFAFGIPAGIFLVVWYAFLYEDRRKSIWGPAPNAACQGVRWLLGVGVIGDWPFGGSPGRNKDDAAHGQGTER
jgi:hypothetical protein